MSYVIAQGVGVFVTYYSQRAGRDYGSASGWVREIGEATPFESEDAASEFIERSLWNEAPSCRVEWRREQIVAPLDHYTVLGLAPGASTAKIKAAFRRLAMQHHPDRNAGDERAAERFRAIRAAFNAAMAAAVK